MFTYVVNNKEVRGCEGHIIISFVFIPTFSCSFSIMGDGGGGQNRPSLRCHHMWAIPYEENKAVYSWHEKTHLFVIYKNNNTVNARFITPLNEHPEALIQDKIRAKGECLFKYLVILMCLKTQKATKSCLIMNLKSTVLYFFCPKVGLTLRFFYKRPCAISCISKKCPSKKPSFK